MKIFSLVKNGKLSQNAIDCVQLHLEGMEGKWVEIDIKPKRRSLAQNRYRFGVIVKTVMNHLNAYLRKEGLPEASTEDVDIFIKDKALGLVHRINTPLGEITIAGKLKDKTTGQFEESMEAIRAHFAGKGIEIPLPHEDLDKKYKHNLEKE